MYTIADLQKEFGSKINPDRNYVIETHRGAHIKLQTGRFKEIGKVPDYSLNEAGIMIVLEQIPSPLPKQKAEKQKVAEQVRPTPKINKPSQVGTFHTQPKSTRKD